MKKCLELLEQIPLKVLLLLLVVLVAFNTRHTWLLWVLPTPSATTTLALIPVPPKASFSASMDSLLKVSKNLVIRAMSTVKTEEFLDYLDSSNSAASISALDTSASPQAPVPDISATPQVEAPTLETKAPVASYASTTRTDTAFVFGYTHFDSSAFLQAKIQSLQKSVGLMKDKERVLLEIEKLMKELRSFDAKVGEQK